MGADGGTPGPEEGPETAAIITTAPNALLAAIHTRMPVMLVPDNEALGLDPGVDSQRALAR